jgi:hypothetical protein
VFVLEKEYLSHFCSFEANGKKMKVKIIFLEQKSCTFFDLFFFISIVSIIYQKKHFFQNFFVFCASVDTLSRMNFTNSTLLFAIVPKLANDN